MLLWKKTVRICPILFMKLFEMCSTFDGVLDPKSLYFIERKKIIKEYKSIKQILFIMTHRIHETLKFGKSNCLQNNKRFVYLMSQDTCLMNQDSLGHVFV